MALIVLGWLWWRAWVSVDAVVAAAVCVAGVALRDIHFRFAWQAWHLATSIVTLRGRCGTYRTGLALVARLGLSCGRGRRRRLHGRRGTSRHPPSLCVAGVALGDIDRNFAWQAWHLLYWAGSGGAFGSSLCVTGVALGDMDRNFAWQAWHLATSIVTLRGTRGTW